MIVEQPDMTRIHEHTVTKRPVPDELVLDPRTVDRFLKIRRQSPGAAAFDSLINDAESQCRPVIDPVFRYSIVALPAGDAAPEVITAGAVDFDSPGLASALKTARAAAFFVLTVGDGVDALSDRLSKTDVATAWFVEGVASAFAHAILECMVVELGQSMAFTNLRVGKRFQPGFHRWDLSDQRKVFDLLHPQEIGMGLTESFVMTPKHSLSGVLSLVPDEPGQAGSKH